MYTISYLKTESSSPKSIHCDDEQLFETLMLIDKVVYSFKVFKEGIKLTRDAFGWGYIPKWVTKFHYQEFEDEYIGKLSDL